MVKGRINVLTECFGMKNQGEVNAPVGSIRTSSLHHHRRIFGVYFLLSTITNFS